MSLEIMLYYKRYAILHRNGELAKACRIFRLYVADNKFVSFKENEVGCIVVTFYEASSDPLYLCLERLWNEYVQRIDETKPDLSVNTGDIAVVDKK